MFNNYRLKFGSTTFPEKCIKDYQVKSEPIIINDYLDGSYNRHIVKAPQDKLTIEFTMPKMLKADYDTIRSLFSDTMTVEYYDPSSDSYKSGTFTYVDSIIPKIATTINGYVIYDATKIKLIRKASA